MRRSVKRILLALLQSLGHDLDPVSLEGALRRIRKWQLNIRTIIDVGASDGRWTRQCRRYFPLAEYLLIEAQAVHLPALTRLSSSWPRVRYVLAAAGDSVGKVYFDATDPQGGIASKVPDEQANWIVLPMTTVDEQIRLNRLAGPFLLKMDTHGFEVPIFEGAQKTLAQTEIVIVETYNFVFSGNNLRFHEMVAFLEARGFRCVDLAEPLHRLHDEALWQFDLVFARTDNPIFQNNHYR